MQKNINIKELESGEIQKERELGVVWNIKRDTFGFNISLKDKPALKRGMLSELSSVYELKLRSCAKKTQNGIILSQMRWKRNKQNGESN